MTEQTSPSGETAALEEQYLSHLFNDSLMPPLSQLKPLFEKATQEEFIRLVSDMMDHNNRELFEQFLYYIILFRDMNNVQDILNDDNTPIEIVERLILYSHGHCALRGLSVENVLDEILYFIRPERLLKLLVTSKHIARDKLFSFFILTKFDRPLLDRYFAEKRDVSAFVHSFMNLPDEMMRSIITRNYRLFQYIMLMIMEDGDVDAKVGGFYEKYKGEIEQLSMLSDSIRKYKKSADLEHEKDLPFGKRNMARIAFLVSRIREMDDPEKAMIYFEGEKVFADENEKELLYEIVTNPMFRHTFLSTYGSFFNQDG
jgi:hypothetical protein